MDKRKKFIDLWKEAGGEQAEKGTLKSLSEQLKVPEGTIRRWKSEYLKGNTGTRRTLGQSERSKSKNQKAKTKVLKEVMKGETQDNIGQKLGVPRSTIANWSAKYKWQVEKELELNNILQEAREKVFGDREKKIFELIEWQQKQLDEIKTGLETEMKKEEPDFNIIDKRMSVLEKFLKAQFKALGIRYTGELTDLVRVANQIETDEKRLELEQKKIENEEGEDAQALEIRIIGVKDDEVNAG